MAKPQMKCPNPACGDILTKPQKYLRAAGAKVVGDHPYDYCPKCGHEISVQDILDGKYDWPPEATLGSRIAFGAGGILLLLLLLKACGS